MRRNIKTEGDSFHTGSDLNTDIRGTENILKGEGLAAWMGYAVRGSLTVEAALIMAVTLFLIASLLRGAFEVHSRVAGSMILQETLETVSRGEGRQPVSDSGKRQAEQRLRQYFRCQNAEIDLREMGNRLEGEVSVSPGGGISVKRFRPERFLRTLRALEP